MKELTLEEKAKRYDEALAKARNILDSTDDNYVCTYLTKEDIKGMYSRFFPELAESEDEKIRKSLIHYLHGLGEFEYPDKKTYNNWLVWLEKQGEQIDNLTPQEAIDIAVAKCFDEQKPTDKVEPKFQNGQWITNGDYTWKIVEVKPLDYILQSQDGNIVDDTISHVDEQFHSFTIEDAKDGDVLLFEGYYNSIVLFQGIGINGKGRINYHCKCDLGNYSFGVQGDVACLGTIEKDSEHYHPATKEQRDLLFQKMHEAGYEWDAEKKELKLLITNGGDFEFENCEQKPANEEMIETLRTEYEKGRADAIAEMQKGWSEEDERICRSIVADIANDKSICKYEISKSICDE